MSLLHQWAHSFCHADFVTYTAQGLVLSNMTVVFSSPSRAFTESPELCQ